MALGDECLDFQAAARWLLYSHETMDHLFFFGGGGCRGRRRKGCNNFIEIKSNENLKRLDTSFQAQNQVAKNGFFQDVVVTEGMPIFQLYPGSCMVSVSANVGSQAVTKPVIWIGKFEYEELSIHQREFTNKTDRENLKNTEKAGVSGSHSC